MCSIEEFDEIASVLPLLVSFEHVLIVAVQEGLVPLAYAMRGCDNEVSRLNAEMGERSLLYVAATRAKRTVTVSYHGKKSEFLK